MTYVAAQQLADKAARDLEALRAASLGSNMAEDLATQEQLVHELRTEENAASTITGELGALAKVRCEQLLFWM